MVGRKLPITVVGALIYLCTRAIASSPIETGTYHCILFLLLIFCVLLLEYTVLDFAVHRA